MPARVNTFEEARYWKAYMMWMAGLRENEPNGHAYASVPKERKIALQEDVQEVVEAIHDNVMSGAS